MSRGRTRCEFLFLQIQGERDGETETEGEVMSSPVWLQLFSRCINMKQDADLRIDGRRGAHNGGKDTKVCVCVWGDGALI